MQILTPFNVILKWDFSKNVLIFILNMLENTLSIKKSL